MAPWVLPPSPGRVPVPLSWHDPSFSLQLVKTHNLLTTRNYIFGYHPHGIMGLGAFCNFSTEATEVSKKFPGIRPYLATLAGNFRMPVLREYLMSGGESSPRPAPAGLCCPGLGLSTERGDRGNRRPTHCVPGAGPVRRDGSVPHAWQTRSEQESCPYGLQDLAWLTSSLECLLQPLFWASAAPGLPFAQPSHCQ